MSRKDDVSRIRELEMALLTYAGHLTEDDDETGAKECRPSRGKGCTCGLDAVLATIADTSR